MLFVLIIIKIKIKKDTPNNLLEVSKNNTIPKPLRLYR